MWNVSLMEIINGKLVNFSSSFAIENIRSDLILNSSFFYFFFLFFNRFADRSKLTRYIELINLLFLDFNLRCHSVTYCVRFVSVIFPSATT